MAQPRTAALRVDGPVVVGYGSRWRRDDGVGWFAATELARDARVRHCRVHARHQLGPDLIGDFASASLLVLIDAESGVRPPGVVAMRPVAPHSTGRPSAPWSHHLDPATLLLLTWRAHHRVPPTVVVSVSAATMEPGVGLSPQVHRALPRIAARVVDLVGTAPPQP